jgi:predicted MFS family arabinose efflux permease
VLLLVGFAALEARLSNPIMPLRILRLGGLTGSSAVRGLTAVGMFASFFLGALYLEHVLGFGPTRTGLAFLPMTLTVGALSTGITARLVGRFGPRRVLLPGLGATIAGLAVLALAGPQAGYFPILFLAFLLVGLGTGTSFLPLLTIAMADVPPRDAGLASGIVNVSMQISAAIGLAALGTISTDHTRALITQGQSLPVSLTGGYQLAFTIAAASVATGLLLAIAILRPRASTEYPN